MWDGGEVQAIVETTKLYLLRVVAIIICIYSKLRDEMFYNIQVSS